MNILVTGANGFVGSNLVRRLLRDGKSGADEAAFSALTLVDIGPVPTFSDPRVRFIRGSIADDDVLRQVFSGRVDTVFHLASVPGGAAEKDFGLGLDVNLRATLAMLEMLREQAGSARFVFASTIAVYGSPMPALVDDSTPFRPSLSYGAHKLVDEILIQDYSRRGWIDGRIVRLPGIVARPPAPSGLMSAFMSDIFWKLAAGQPFTCPVSEDAVAWWMSVRCCVDNLLHAANLCAAVAAARRDYTLPVLRVRIGELVDGLARRFGDDRRALVSYAPDAALEQAFGRFPPLDATQSERIGFRHDGHIDALISNAMADLQA
ncbi:NAD-dependent epimerase/dehydratase family protein [Massilia sp. METH4]|uniref:NAD-dependent epimerase/dehydratase family protein n=1 Tax=Massilia sp. METH4 TaxID=3123041 RepID=UPI0030D1FD9A